MSIKSATPVDIATGHRIRARRIERCMSQTDLARHLGVTFQQVQKYEKGVNRVGAGRLHEIATALEVPVLSLIGENKEPAFSPLGDRLVSAQWGARLAAAYLAIGEGDQREALVRMAESLAVHPAA